MMPSYKTFFSNQSDFVTLRNRSELPDSLTINKVGIEELYNPTSRQKEKSIVAYFHETNKKMVLSSMRCEAIDKAGHGDDYTKWVGLQISLGEGKAPQGGRMLTVTKAVRGKGQKPNADSVTSQPEQQPSTEPNATQEAYLAALRQVNALNLPAREVDVSKYSDGQLSYFRTELERSIIAYRQGKIEPGAVHPYVAKCYVYGMKQQAGDSNGEPVNPDEYNQLIASLVKNGVTSGHAQVGVKWLCGSHMPDQGQFDAILALMSQEGIELKTTFQWIFKTAEEERETQAQE